MIALYNVLLLGINLSSLKSTFVFVIKISDLAILKSEKSKFSEIRDRSFFLFGVDAFWGVAKEKYLTYKFEGATKEIRPCLAVAKENLNYYC